MKRSKVIPNVAQVAVKRNQTADGHAKEKNNDNHLLVDFHSLSPFFSVSNPWSLPILPLQPQVVTGGAFLNLRAGSGYNIASELLPEGELADGVV